MSTISKAEKTMFGRLLIKIRVTKIQGVVFAALLILHSSGASAADDAANPPPPKPKYVKSIKFKTGTSRIADLKSLERFAGWLRVKSDVKNIRLEGFHCYADRKKDGVKPEEMLDYLLFIARERAEAVRAALIARGMDGRNFDIVPLGISEDPATCKVIAMALEPEKKPEVISEKKPETAAVVPGTEKPALKVEAVSGKN